MKKIALSGLLISLLTACASEAPKSVAPVEKTPVANNGNKIGQAVATEIDPLDDPKTGLTYRSLYYALDVDVIQEADRPLVGAHAKYLAAHQNRSVRLEGNADERGSNEYNLALGQRRADGVKKLMLLGGAKEAQLNSISYGEEKPRNTNHNEDGWAENRRTDLNYAK